MLRSLKKIRKSINEAQRNRSSGSGGGGASSSDGDEDQYYSSYYREFDNSTTPISEPVTSTGNNTISDGATPSSTNTTSTGNSFGRTASGGSNHATNSTTTTNVNKATNKTPTFRSITTKARNVSGGSNSISITMIDKQALMTKVPYLSSFDKCIEASDAMIASCYSSADYSKGNGAGSDGNNHTTGSTNQETIFATRTDKATGLPDCSLLVSPDGDLLLVPNEQENIYTMFQPPTKTQLDIQQLRTNKRNVDTSEVPAAAVKAVAIDTEGIDGDDYDDDVGLNQNTSPPSTSLGSFSELMRQSKDDYESAMFIGNDLHGDKVINRFSAKGWSVPATTLAVQQTEHTIRAMAHFCEQYVLTRKESAAQMTIACDQWRNELDRRRGFQTNRVDELPMTSERWEILDPRATSFELSPNRVGPFTSHGSTLYAAIMAMEQYHHEAAEKESNRWRKATLQRNGIVPAIQTALSTYHARATKRQKALSEMSHRAQIIEQKIRQLKQVSEQKWDTVYKAEDRVTIRMEELMTERSKERQKARLKLLLRDQQQENRNNLRNNTPSSSTNAPTTGGTFSVDDIQLTCNLSDEVWDMVSSVAESMEHGSFEPIPDNPSTISDENSSIAFDKASSNDPYKDEVLVSYPIVSREEIEQEMHVPELRAAARQVDDEIQDESDTLLNILSSLDTTRRSARTAAETCLISAGNAQVSCLNTMLQLERESLQERLRDLDGLEHVLNNIDVRADLDTYITADRKEIGGCSHLGDDDDGGIASALAVLSSHVDGIITGQETPTKSSLTAATTPSASISTRQRGMSFDQSPDANNESDSNGEGDISTEELNNALDKLFQRHPALDALDMNDLQDEDDDHEQYRIEFDNNVNFLYQSIAGNSKKGQKRRSLVCYLLNSKRGIYACIPSMKQYNALSQLFTIILTNGVYDNEIGISNAKMCMMLAQTFYYLKDSSINVASTPTVNDNTAKKEFDDGPVESTSDPTTGDLPIGNTITSSITNADDDHDHGDELNLATRKSRRCRLYIKNAISGHAIWAKDDFWYDEYIVERICFLYFSIFTIFPMFIQHSNDLFFFTALRNQKK
jgi:hypothetical protein